MAEESKNVDHSDDNQHNLVAQQNATAGVAEPRRKNGKNWPSIYDESRRMMSISILIYFVVEVRGRVRKGLITDPEIVNSGFMREPSYPEQLLPLVAKHKKTFQQVLGEEDEFYLDNLLKERDLSLEDGDGGEKPQSNGSDGVGPNREGDNNSHSSRRYVITVMEDENSEQEMVYSLSVDHDLQWIEIVFRGSVTTRDFIADADPLMSWYRNPVGGIAGYEQDEKIAVHAGFAFYLNGTIKELGEGKSKRIKESVIALQQEYPHYRIYMTGHSLGGALATLMAFQLASDPEVGKPITCVSVASPKVGNIGFLRAVQCLEKKGHLRCMRVVNKLDLIPSLPTKACCCIDFCCCGCFGLGTILQSRRYWHVGAKILLIRNGSCEISYARHNMTYREQLRSETAKRRSARDVWAAMLRAGSCGKGDGDFLKNHSCKEYMERLTSVGDELDAKYLQELYFRQARQSINQLGSSPPELSSSLQRYVSSGEGEMINDLEVQPDP